MVIAVGNKSFRGYIKGHNNLKNKFRIRKIRHYAPHDFTYAL